MKDFDAGTSQPLHPAYSYKQSRESGQIMVYRCRDRCVAGVCCCRRACSRRTRNGRLKVYLDCNNCFGDYIREEVDMVEYVRDPAEADVHIIVSRSDTGSGGIERAVALIGLGRFKGLDFKSRALSQSGDTEDTQRQRLATAITIGLLNYLSSDGVQRRVDGRGRADRAARPGRPRDRSVEFLGDERAGLGRDDAARKAAASSTSSAEFGADRITDDWKITMGFEIEHSREDFDLDEDEPLRAVRNERDFDALVARSLNDHWSIGGRAQHRFVDVRQHRHSERSSARRSNTTSSRIRSTRAGSCASATPSVLTTRGTAKRRCCSRCPTRWRSRRRRITLDQREPWGSLQAELEYSTFLPDASLYRIQLEGDVNVRLARGLSLSHRRQRRAGIRDQTFDSPPGRDRRGSAAAPPPPAQRLRIQPADRADLHVRIDLQHDRQSTVRAVNLRVRPVDRQTQYTIVPRPSRLY